MQLRASLQAPVQKRLSMYVLRSKVELINATAGLSMFGVISHRLDAVLQPLFSSLPQTPLSLAMVEDAMLLRLDEKRLQIIVPVSHSDEMRSTLSGHGRVEDASNWDRMDIKAGIPWITPATQEQFVPQMANLELIGGVSFNKGCYPGQEIIARLHYLGRLKERMYLGHVAADESPAPGDSIFDRLFGEQAIGMIVNVTAADDGGHDLLAVLKIDSAEHGDLHWRSHDGPRLELGQLPYSV